MKIKLSLYGYFLAIKYWAQGDPWIDAKEWAYFMTNAFKHPKEK